MSIRKVGRLVLVVAGIATLTACNPFSGALTYRYRVTVEVDTPQGIRSGSSVWETSAFEGSGIPDRAIRSRVRGEAVVVDLQSGTLFALLRGQNLDGDYASGAVEGHLRAHPLPNVAMGPDWKANIREVIAAKPTFELHHDEYPLLVRFNDSHDARSIEVVNTTGLGGGVRLRRVSVAVTDDPVTTGVKTRLPNFGKGSNYLAWRRMLPRSDPRRHITRSDFVKD